MIAVSIVMVAAEVVHMERGKLSLAIVRPWMVAFAFGLLHGFGFAGALVELGLPQGDIPLALFAFNVGVELGQLAFIAVLLSAVYLCEADRHHPARGDHGLGLCDRHRRGILVRPAAGRDVSMREDHDANYPTSKKGSPSCHGGAGGRDRSAWLTRIGVRL